MIPLDNDDLLSLSESAEVLGVKPASLRVMRSRGEFIDEVGRLGREPAFRRSEVEAERDRRQSRTRREPEAKLSTAPAEAKLSTAPAEADVIDLTEADAEPDGAASETSEAGILAELERLFPPLTGALRREVYAVVKSGDQPDAETLSALLRRVKGALP